MELPPDLPFGIAEQCEPLVARILARNPSPYTYTGTQSYLVGTGTGGTGTGGTGTGGDVAVIDPGPADPAHIDAIIAAIAGRPVTAIMCTHTHRDHSPAAAPLAERTGAPIIGCAPLALDGDSDGPRSDESFDKYYAPDRVLTNGEQIKGQGWTIEAVATPGHTSNHLCYAVLESGALFTGDHVMKWSTSVVVPPDGDMAAYMRSLDKLQARDDRVYYPAHGPAVENPRQLVRGMIGHRRQRERQIMKLLDEAPQPIAAMVARMYAGLDPRLVGAAKMSVLAHLIDLEQRGVAGRAHDIWHPLPTGIPQ